MKYLLIIILVAIVAASTTSCESRDERFERLHGVKPDVKPIGTMLVHPDMLTNHILIEKSKIGVDNAMIRTYNYVDSVYVNYYIPIVYAKLLTPLDTIHVTLGK